MPQLREADLQRVFTSILQEIHMTDQQPPTPQTFEEPPVFNTATLIGFVTGWFIVLTPFLEGAGRWIQERSSGYIVFPVGYIGMLQTAIMGTIMVGIAIWHTHKPKTKVDRSA